MKSETIKALRGLKVHTGSLQCMGCGYEHNCGVHGCAIIRQALQEAEQDAKERDAAVEQLAALEICGYCKNGRCRVRGGIKDCKFMWCGPQTGNAHGE